jgi:hypothetical protein
MYSLSNITVTFYSMARGAAGSLESREGAGIWHFLGFPEGMGQEVKPIECECSHGRLLMTVDANWGKGEVSSVFL